VTSMALNALVDSFLPQSGKNVELKGLKHKIRICYIDDWFCRSNWEIHCANLSRTNEILL